MKENIRKSLLLAIVLILASSSISFARVVKEYFPDGKLYSVQVYYSNGSFKGPYKLYWPNGRLRQKVEYKNGRPSVIQNWTQNGVRE